jgi:hypothetical protein
MKGRPAWFLLFVGLLVTSALIVFFMGAPRLVAYFPENGARDLSQGTPLRLTFSRPLQIESQKPYLLISPSVEGTVQWQGSTLIFQPAEPWPAGAAIQVRLDPGALALDFPPIPLREGAQWTFWVHQPALAYLYPASGAASLYQVDPVNGEQRLLRDSASGLLDFTVSTRESLIYYSERLENGGSAIYRMPIESAKAAPQLAQLDKLPEPELVLECPKAFCQALALEPNGRFLAYERTALPGADEPRFPQVWILPLADDPEPSPFLAGDPSHQTELPNWSAAGVLAFYDRTDQVYRFDEPGFEERSSFPNQTGAAGSWHPDSEAFLAAEIIFLDESISPQLSDLDTLADSHLILFHLNDGSIEDLTPGDGIEDTSPVYSPNGEFLVFARKYLDTKNWTPGRQIWIAQVSNRESRPLSDDPLYNHFDFSWGPGSDQLAYVRYNKSALSEPLEIWILDLLTGQATQLVQGGYKPQWIP